MRQDDGITNHRKEIWKYEIKLGIIQKDIEMSKC